MPSWSYNIYPIAYAPGLESTQGANLPMYIQESRQEDGGWTTVARHQKKQRKLRKA
jgi:hypothetical protein